MFLRKCLTRPVLARIRKYSQPAFKNIEEELESIVRKEDSLILSKAKISDDEMQFLSKSLYDLDKTDIQILRREYVSGEIDSTGFARKASELLLKKYGIKEEVEEPPKERHNEEHEKRDYKSQSTNSERDVKDVKDMTDEEFNQMRNDMAEKMERLFKPRGMSSEEFRKNFINNMSREEYMKRQENISQIKLFQLPDWKVFLGCFFVFSILPRLLGFGGVPERMNEVQDNNTEVVTQIGPITIKKRPIEPALYKSRKPVTNSRDSRDNEEGDSYWKD